MVGYCQLPEISSLCLYLMLQWLARLFVVDKFDQLTEVVLTPQSNAGVTGEGAGGVSTHSKFSSEVLLLILHFAGEFWKLNSSCVVVEFMGCQAITVWCEELTFAAGTFSSDHSDSSMLRMPLQLSHV